MVNVKRDFIFRFIYIGLNNPKQIISWAQNSINWRIKIVHQVLENNCKGGGSIFVEGILRIHCRFSYETNLFDALTYNA